MKTARFNKEAGIRVSAKQQSHKKQHAFQKIIKLNLDWCLAFGSLSMIHEKYDEIMSACGPS